jgi:hypothetical protein
LPGFKQPKRFFEFAGREPSELITLANHIVAISAHLRAMHTIGQAERTKRRGNSSPPGAHSLPRHLIRLRYIADQCLGRNGHKSELAGAIGVLGRCAAFACECHAHCGSGHGLSRLYSTGRKKDAANR